jgi:hypothetical protein
MSYCEIAFEGKDFEGAENMLGGLRDKLLHAANNEALYKFDHTNWQNPTDMKILPVMTLDEPRFLVNAYHSTESTAGQVATFKNYDFSFAYSVEGEEAYLRTDTEHAYPLTPRELYFLMQLGDLALAKSVNTI